MESAKKKYNKAERWDIKVSQEDFTEKVILSKELKTKELAMQTSGEMA